MLYLNINYNIHLLLNSKYRVLINLLIILVIYSVLYDNKISYCMNENRDLTEIPTAESKEPIRSSHQVIALKKEILDFAESQIPLLEEINELKAICEAKDITFQQQQEKLNDLQLENNSLEYELKVQFENLHDLIKEKNDKIEYLERILKNVEEVKTQENK